MNRQELLRNAGIIGAATLVPATLASAQTPEMQTSGEAGATAKIAGTREEFDATFGPGTEGQGFVIYGDRAAGEATYSVTFNTEGMAESILIDFTGLEGGGLASDGELGQSQFIYDDAEPGVLTTMGTYRGDESQYAVLNWSSPTLADATGRSGNTIVIDQVNYAGPDAGTIIVSTSISMETFEVNPIVPTGERLGVHNTLEEWTEFVSTAGGNTDYLDGQFGLLYSDEIANYVISEDSVSATFAKPLTSPEVAQMASEMLPAGAEIAYTTLTPFDGWVRVHGLVYEGQSIVVGQWVGGGGEENGEPTKMMFGSALF